MIYSGAIDSREERTCKLRVCFDVDGYLFFFFFFFSNEKCLSFIALLAELVRLFFLVCDVSQAYDENIYSAF